MEVITISPQQLQTIIANAMVEGAKQVLALASKSNEPDQVLSLSEAAKYLKMSDNALRQLVYGQKIPYTQVGRNYKFLKSELVNFLKSK